MGVLRRFITEPRPMDSELISDKLLTPANALTATRPLLAAKAARMLLAGDRYVTPLVVVMAATDMEGAVARFVDKRWPDAGRGTTKSGIVADKYADVAAILCVAGATLRAPRVAMAAKAAVAVALGQEGTKVAWALNRGAQYRTATSENLDFPANALGKESMAEKLIAVSAAVATNDTDSHILRTGLCAVAAGFAGSGALHGEQARREYDELFQELMAEAYVAPELHDVSEPAS